VTVYLVTSLPKTCILDDLPAKSTVQTPYIYIYIFLANPTYNLRTYLQDTVGGAPDEALFILFLEQPFQGVLEHRVVVGVRLHSHTPGV